jgi:hypothetical protein
VLANEDYMQYRFVFSASLLALALPAAAQKSGATAPADAAKVPPARYESVFSEYKGFKEPALAPWREVNEEVARAGGHVGIVGGAGGHGAAKPNAPETRSPSPASAREPARGAPQAPGHDAHHR